VVAASLGAASLALLVRASGPGLALLAVSLPGCRVDTILASLPSGELGPAPWLLHAAPNSLLLAFSHRAEDLRPAVTVYVVGSAAETVVTDGKMICREPRGLERRWQFQQRFQRPCPEPQA
jgi:hypothetical protein